MDLSQLPPLPIDEVLPGLPELLCRHGAVVLTAPPGAGKTTRVPLTLAASDKVGHGQILLLEPRRMAARACASHMAALLDEPVGRTVGFQVRFFGRHSKDTRILVVTEGILTRRFIDDPLLEGVSCVIIDEFHERSVHADLALAFCRETMRARDDLRLMVMSATMDPREVSAFLFDCPIVEVEGRPFPVEVTWADGMDGTLEVRTAAAIRRVLAVQEDGDVLVFLPGAGEIERVRRSLHGLAGVEVLPLYGALPAQAQDAVLQPGTRRRIILSTNIAETSLTIPGVRVVVDSGLVKRVQWAPSGLDRLDTVKTSLYSAVQRAGRAGRTAPGFVYRMWTRALEKEKPVADEPEIRRVDPASFLLPLLLSAPGDPEAFPLLTRPVGANVKKALALLRLLGALSEDSFILTPKGRRLAELPLHPRIGAVLLAAADGGDLHTGALYAAILSSPDIFDGGRFTPEHPAPRVSCDVAFRAECLAAFEARGMNEAAAAELGLRWHYCREVLQLRDALKAATKGWTGFGQRRHALLAGFPDRVCRLLDNRKEGKMAGGSGVALTDETGVRDEPLFLVLDARSGKKGLHSRGGVTLASAVSERDLAAQFPHLLVERDEAFFDESRDAAFAMRVRRFMELELSSSPVSRPDPALLSSALAAYAAAHPERALRLDGASLHAVERLRFAARQMPDAQWPDVSTEGLMARLPEVCAHMRSLDELRNADWSAVLYGALSPASRRLLERSFPTHVVLPSGTKTAIDYSAGLQEGGTPMIAGRLQEFFGMKETPKIADGAVALTVTLLSPARRPVQVTRDLTGFWTTGYPAVRKELRARYARHFWPEDPLSAPPTNKVKPRR